MASPAQKKDQNDYNQVLEFFQTVADLTSRTDEKVKGLLEHQIFLDKEIDKLKEKINQLIHLETLEEEIDELKEAINKLIRLESLEKEIHEIREILDKLKNLENSNVFDLKSDYNHTLLKLKVAEEEFDKVKKRFDEFESKLNKINEKYKDQDAANQSRKSLLNMLLDIVFRIVLMVTGGYILYKLGLQSPPN